MEGGESGEYTVFLEAKKRKGLKRMEWSTLSHATDWSSKNKSTEN